MKGGAKKSIKPSKGSPISNADNCNRRFGITTLTNEITEQVRATDVRFENEILNVSLSDGREVSNPIDTVEWLDWLHKATPEQRNRWSIEPGGFAIYWENLDDGIEICHLLNTQPLVR
ncbi:MAG: DUF2442 domain-containing protein [bacterium]